MNKWDQWYDSLSANTQAHLSNQPVWHDRDLFKFSAIAFVLGVLLGLAI
jgi:hypothetical protein